MLRFDTRESEIVYTAHIDLLSTDEARIWAIVVVGVIAERGRDQRMTRMDRTIGRVHHQRMHQGAADSDDDDSSEEDDLA